jgi:kinetochore protein Spc24
MGTKLHAASQNPYFLALSQSLAAARSAAVRPAEVPSAAEHSRKVNHMDGERFQLFKSIKEAEEKTETREAELARAREELKMLENRDVVDEVELDGVA